MPLWSVSPTAWPDALREWSSGRSAGKQSACSAGDPSSIPGSGRSTGEGRDYPFRILGLPPLVKNLPVMRETLVQTLGWEDPLEKGTATHSSILGLPLWLGW